MRMQNRARAGQRHASGARRAPLTTHSVQPSDVLPRPVAIDNRLTDTQRIVQRSLPGRISRADPFPAAHPVGAVSSTRARQLPDRRGARLELARARTLPTPRLPRRAGTTMRPRVTAPIRSTPQEAPAGGPRDLGGPCLAKPPRARHSSGWRSGESHEVALVRSESSSHLWTGLRRTLVPDASRARVSRPHRAFRRPCTDWLR